MSPTLTCGAQQDQTQKQSPLERVLPKIRSMVSPLVTVVPTLYAGMLLGGIPALEGLLVVLLVVAFAFVVNVVAGVIAQVV